MAWITQGVGAISGLSVAIAYLVAQDAYTPEHISLSVAQAEYVEIGGVGHIRQQIVSSSGDPVPAIWSASITRKDKVGASYVLCSGTGGSEQPGQYSGDVDLYNLDEWTGDDCSDKVMRPGDIAEATWTYVNEYGLSVTIGTEVRLKDEN